jgi:mannose/fructose/N-acetylgalactosamine-specific phosphotransferase system component IID
MRDEALTPALERFYRSERAARIAMLKRHIAAHLTRGIAPELLGEMMTELLTLQEIQDEQ